MVRSMTGFGRACTEEGKERSFSIEIKSVNHRYLDINIRMPKSMFSLEDKIRRCIKETLNRGKVDLFINYKNYAKTDSLAKVNLDFAKTYVSALENLKEAFPEIKNDISLSLISKHPDVIITEEKEENLDDIWSEIEPLLKKSINGLVEMRRFEGGKLKDDIINKTFEIESLVNSIAKKADVLVSNYKAKLEERLKEILKTVDIDENRIAMELAIFADKVAVDEEITRLNSHIIHLRETLSLSEPVGRKLDFIMQEMNREANTIASKSTDLNITNKVIDIKNILEKIREQVQNIE
ncbi:MAG: YicC/YloC family endoribonuclease [Sarcina sp.]